MGSAEIAKSAKLSVKTYTNRKGAERLQFLSSVGFARLVAEMNREAIEVLVDKLRAELGLDVKVAGSVMEVIGDDTDSVR